MEVTSPTFNDKYMQKVKHPLYFLLTIPTNISVFKALTNIIQNGTVGVTNIPKSILSDMNLNIATKIDNLIYLPELPYSSTKLDFSISSSNNYQSIVDITKLLPGTNSALFNYAMLGKGKVLETNISNAVKMAVGGKEGQSANDIYTMLKEEGGKGFVKGNLLTAGLAGSALLGVAAELGTEIVNLIKKITKQMGQDTTLIYDHLGKNSNKQGNAANTNNGSINLLNFNAFLSPKIWSGTTTPFPTISLKTSYICKKDTTQLVDLLNWIQEISSPLTLALPVVPLQLYYFNIDSKNETSVSTNKDSTNNGLRPFTYTQKNYGVFNLISATISDLGMGVANNTDSTFYKQSGIPLPIGVKIELKLEIFDPFFYQLYTAKKTYTGSSGSK